MENNYKEVLYHKYCRNCEHWDILDGDDPCDECLDNPVNLYSHKPIHYKEKEK